MSIFESAWHNNGSSQYHLLMALFGVCGSKALCGLFFFLVVALFAVLHFLAMKMNGILKLFKCFCSKATRQEKVSSLRGVNSSTLRI